MTLINPLFKNASTWCTQIGYEVSYGSWRTQRLRRQLPKGIFLICGDRAFSGIPTRLVGGPCTLGHLSWLTPNVSLILSHTYLHHSRQKRATLDPNCNSRVDLWNQGEIIAAGLFMPGVAGAQALKQLNNLACWLGKQTNLQKY